MFSKRHLTLIVSALAGALMLLGFQNCGTKLSSDQSAKPSTISVNELSTLSLDSDSEIIYRKSFGGMMPPMEDSEVLTAHTMDRAGRLYGNYRDGSRKLIVEIGAWLPNHYLSQMKRVSNIHLYEFKAVNDVMLFDYYMRVEVQVNGQLKKIKALDGLSYELVPNGAGLIEGTLDYKSVVEHLDQQVAAIISAQSYK